jgi:hypothetical protein
MMMARFFNYNNKSLAQRTNENDAEIVAWR